MNIELIRFSKKRRQEIEALRSDLGLDETDFLILELILANHVNQFKILVPWANAACPLIEYADPLRQLPKGAVKNFLSAMET